MLYRNKKLINNSQKKARQKHGPYIVTDKTLGKCRAIAIRALYFHFMFYFPTFALQKCLAIIGQMLSKTKL